MAQCEKSPSVLPVQLFVVITNSMSHETPIVGPSMILESTHPFVVLISPDLLFSHGIRETSFLFSAKL